MLDAYLGLDSDEETLWTLVSGSFWVLGTMESERKGGESTCEIFEVSQRATSAPGTCVEGKGHNGASWHNCRRMEPSLVVFPAGFTQMPA